ncbi:hypothetical protein B0I35DRAFT_416927 [Stachybotrys elegans]|uniref:Uncharacterized protein n=1 Tax=Stachybotrys elegans TaxID=80388 RepID=A0A8K0WW31_9HYPO|nr:hypothetical protein B0I35DRAFT_416927 [Stachybotrys elegans]
MTRRLPWKRDESDLKPTRTPDSPATASPQQIVPKPPGVRSSSPTKRKRESESNEEDETAEPNQPRNSTHDIPSRARRSPSTSPPREPPQEKHIDAGSDADDRFRMVEDEFLHVAQRFTERLHRAEYARLKLLASKQNAAAISQIERPVVGRETTDTRRRREAAGRVIRQRGMLQENATASALPWAGTGLQGLMNRPSTQAEMVPYASSSQPKTRAAAGFLSSASSQHPSVHRHTPQRPGAHGLARNAGTSPSSHTRSPNATVHQLRPATSIRPSKVSTLASISDDDEDDPFGLQRRQMRREQSREQLRKTQRQTAQTAPSRDTIPSFL